MTLTTKAPKPTQDKSPSSTSTLRVTVTGVDSGGQLFRDQTTVVYLKGQECIYDSKYKPSADGSVMVEFPPGPGSKDAWRANGKVKRVSPGGSQQTGFRVTVELDRAHSAVIDALAPDTGGELPGGVAADAQGGGPRPVVTVPSAAPAQLAHATSTIPATNEITPPAQIPVPVTLPAPRTMVADIVRSVMGSELEQLKRELQGTIPSQVEAALREPVKALEAKIEQQARARPQISEDLVRKIAAQAAESVHTDWATTKLQKIIADAVNSAVASECEQRGREIKALVAAEMEAAVRGPIASQVDSALEKALEAKMERYFRTRPSITEETARQIAAQVAENTQAEWAAAKLQPMVMDIVRPALASSRGANSKP
jgi:hypothetical protein